MLSVVRVVGLATRQDLGVRGHMHLALAPGGALVPELLVAANRTVENPDDAIGIEVQGRLVLTAEVDTPFAIDDRPAELVPAGREIEVTSGARRCAYLAVRGGLAGTPSQGRGRGDVLSAQIGAPLVAGSRLAGAGLSTRPTRHDAGHGLDRDEPILVVAGPDLDAFDEEALALLSSQPYRIEPASNRVGTRLSGAALPRRAGVRERTRPMVLGALEVPLDGQPIVLGPEHPTTGGYPLIAVIATADLGRFHAIRLGGNVRFAVG